MKEFFAVHLSASANFEQMPHEGAAGCGEI
jgi:hypothetical protein